MELKKECIRVLNGYVHLYNPGSCITNVFATRRKNFCQWHRSFQRKLLSHWLKFLRHVAITLVIQGPEMLRLIVLFCLVRHMSIMMMSWQIKPFFIPLWREFTASRGPVLLLRHDAVARILANGSAAFIESCAAIGWNFCDSVRSL